jgi:hypothetical protein
MRRADWEARLSAYLARVDRRPYQPGRHDCAMFAAGAVRAVTGRDPGRGWRGQYRSAARGKALLASRGFDSLDAAASAALGEPCAPAMCGRGDIVSDGERLGVLWWAGGPVALFVGDAGLEPLPVANLVQGWRL